VKTVSELNVIGKPHNRIDAVEKVTGRARYTGDIRIPGMVYAKVLRPPAHGAKLKSLDTSAVDKIEGFQVIRDDDLVAVLHKNPNEAEKLWRKSKPSMISRKHVLTTRVSSTISLIMLRMEEWLIRPAISKVDISSPRMWLSRHT
jgi:CO/xanthine dehydrogenase Mo-binding subunit